MTIVGRERLRPVRHDLPVASAQLLGAAALAGLAADGETVIAAPGPTRDHTERMLAAAGVDIRRDGLVTTLRGPARPLPLEVTVPGDVSSAAPWLVAAALHPDADVTILGVGLNPTRTALVDLLREAGADVTATVTDADGPRADRRAACPRRQRAPADRGGREPGRGAHRRAAPASAC